MSNEQRKQFIMGLTFAGVQFQNPEVGTKIKQLAQSVILEDKRAGKQLNEFWNATVQNSGILGLVDRAFSGATGVTSADRRQTLEYFRALDSVTGKNDIAGEAGAIAGILGDIAITSLVLSPATGAAKAAIQTAASGGKAMLASAKALNVAAPIMNRGLHYFGPIAAEAAIEAIPYFFIEEQRRLQQGQVSVTSQGAGEIAKTLGMNAALDFAVGSVATKLLELTARTGRAVFRKGMKYDTLISEAMTEDALLARTIAGDVSPEFLAQLPPVERARHAQMAAIFEYTRKGATDPESYVFGRDALVALNLKKILEEVPTPQGATYKIWEFNPAGKPATRTYQSLRDAEDYLSYQYISSQEDLAKDLVKKNPGITYEEALVSPEITRSENLWALQRGSVLKAQESRFNPDLVKDDNPFFQRSIKDTPTWWRKIKNRPLITRGEADALVGQNNGSLIAIPAQVELKGNILESVNAGSVNLMHGMAPVNVVKSDTPNALFIGNSPAPLEAYTTATKYAESVLQKGAYKSVPEARAAYLMNRGYDYYINPEGTYEFFTARNMKLIGTVDDVVAPISKAVQSGQASTASIITDSKKAFLKGSAAIQNDELVVESAVKALRSKDTAKIADFGNMYLRGLGYEPKGVTMKYTPGYQKATAVVTADGLVELRLPRAYRSFNDERLQLDALFRGLQDIAAKNPASAEALKKLNRATQFYVDSISKNPLRFSLADGVEKDSWLKFATDKLGGKLEYKNNTYNISLSNGGKVFSNIDEAIDWVAKQTLDENAIVNDLLAQGTRIQKLKDGTFVARSLNKNVYIAEASNLNDLMTKLDYVPKTLDIRYGPQVINWTPEGITFEFNGTTYLKNQKEAQKFLAKFSDHQLLSRKKFLKVNSKGDLSILPDGKYHVYNATLDYHKDFDTLADARKFFEQDSIKKLDDIDMIAHAKFLDFYTENGQYVLKDMNGTLTKADTLDELYANLAKYPDLKESVPELIPLDPELQAALPDIARQFKLRTWDIKSNRVFKQVPEVPEFAVTQEPFSVGFTRTLRRLSAEFFGWTDEIANKYNVPELANFKVNIQNALRSMRMETQNAGAYLNRIFKDANGKQLSPDSRRKIFYTLGAKPGTEEATQLGAMYQLRYNKLLSELNPAERAAADKLTDYYKYLSDKFGIDYHKLIHTYMPRIRDKMPQELLEQLTGEEAIAYLRKTVPEWNSDVPTEIKVWFENERVNDIPKYFLKDDAYEVALLYTAQGLKKYHLNEPFMKMRRWLQTAGSKADPIIGQRITEFEADIMGSPATTSERILADFGRKFARSLKNGPLGKLIPYSPAEAEDIGSNILNNVMGLTYFSSMGFKPWLAIRNTMQTDTMLAMRVGLDWTYKAKFEVLRDLDKWTKYGFEKGVLSAKAPIVNLMQSQGKFGKLSESAFNMFKNSDDYTRLVAYVSGDLRATNAINAYRLNPNMSKGKFLEMSGLDRFNPTYGERAWNFLQEGVKSMNLGTKNLVDVVTGKAIDAELPPTNTAFQAIKDMYGQLLQRSTMFDYSGASTPQMFRGVVGKLFGQYGTYSAGFRSNIAEAMRYGTTAQKAASIATYLAITTAYWQAFEAMKIRTNDFIPFAPAAFGGGPMFDMATNLAKAGSPDWEGAQAREALKRDLLTMAPGSSQARYLGKMIQAADDGDVTRLAASSLMIPMYSE
jgi:hypothetical protein